MTEKLGKDESIARVYQFLSDRTNWRNEADTNKDEVINQTEFRGFMLKNVDSWNNEWNGEQKYDANDIITKFWKSVDVNKSGTTIQGYNNVNHLTEKELVDMEKNIALNNVIKKYVEELVKATNFGFTGNYAEQFKKSVGASLLNKAIEHFKSDNTCNPEDKTNFESTVRTYLATVKDESVRKASADCYKSQALDEYKNKIDAKYRYDKTTNPNGYNIYYDSDLDRLIENYIQNIKNSNATPDEIKSAINTLINDYFTTALIGNSSQTGQSTSTFRDSSGNVISASDSSINTSAARLQTFGGIYPNSFNDLQTKILSTDLTEQIKNAIKGSVYKELYEERIAEFDVKISEYVQTTIKANESLGFSELKSKISKGDFNAGFLSQMEAIKQQLQNEALMAARANLKAACKYGDKYKEALEAVFGAGNNTKEKVEAEIDKINDIAVLESKLADIKSRIEAIDNYKPTEITDKSVSIYSALGNVVNTKGRLTFRIEADGSVTFVVSTKSDVFSGYTTENYNDDNYNVETINKDTSKDDIFNITLKNEILSQYKDELKEIFGDNESAKSNLFNMALVNALQNSDEFFKETIFQQIITKVIQTFISMLTKVANSSSLKGYVEQYPNSSILAGANPNDSKSVIYDYYTKDSTTSDDNWVSVDKYESRNYTSIYGSGSIYYLNHGSKDDDDKTNLALESLLNDYINRYHDLISASTIISKFKEAEKTAFDKLYKGQQSENEDVYKGVVYGYGDHGNARGYANDTYAPDHVSAQSVLLQVMFEMEALLTKELFK